MKVKDLRSLLEGMDGDSELVISIEPKHENSKYNIPIFANGIPQWGCLDIYSYVKTKASKAVVEDADGFYDMHIRGGHTIPYCEAYTFDSFINRYARLLKLGYKPIGPFTCGFDTIYTQRTEHRVPLFSIQIQKCK